MLVELTIKDLTVGMYLVEIIAPKGKFLLRESGLIKEQKTILNLQKRGVERVLIDNSYVDPNLEEKKSLFKEDIIIAKRVFDESKVIQKKIFYDAENGNPLDLNAVNSITDESIDLIFKNPDALSCVLNLRKKDEYLLEHSVAVSVLITLFAFHLKIEKEIVRKLAVGAFLHDVGKIKIADEVLNKPGKFTDAEFTIMKKHAQYSIDIVKAIPGIDALSLEVVALHHEQLSGGGYPAALQEDEISFYGRMISICDIFDALTSTRCYKAGMAQVKAFNILRNLAKTNHLDKVLVDQFILCMGIYPVGSIVRLDSDHLAIVESQNKDDPIRPHVKPFYCLGGNEFSAEKNIDLSTTDAALIVKCVRASDFNLDMQEIIDYLAHQG
ncbi:metal dependent phosphohydrolase [Psychromonas sp. CNPT3]|uniref:HD-GYP domain-containing protein n=1 Tax=Psychromonas sp. CNPT3 TaxID=314282 RepID=UPI00006E4844|nr:HD-GYP domain-containing protein [Psychromonas sp. CNPT3]AGH81826.1 metal dependent phosphohydrolase [Psychromonas sp. CNPT3]